MSGMTTAEKITLLGIGITFLIGIINLVLLFRNTKKTLFINTITSQRIKWIGELRSLVSQYVSTVSLHEHKNVEKDGDRGKYLDNILLLESQIKLHLNFQGRRDKAIIQLVERIRSNIFSIYDFVTLLELKPEEREKKFIDQNFEDMKKMIENKVDENFLKSIPKDTSLEEVIRLLYNDVYNNEVTKYNAEFKHKFKKHREGIKEDVAELVLKTQIYLKSEWDRVKRESVGDN
ncbi:hypothetical protein ACFQZE_11735 [Paenibacillus sp. GCM10027627]|uniref:hypothetical protein n=1 Tax=unclassified Paenibacillus TaxID=185978 RepID=UPI00363F9A63